MVAYTKCIFLSIKIDLSKSCSVRIIEKLTGSNEKEVFKLSCDAAAFIIVSGVSKSLLDRFRFNLWKKRHSSVTFFLCFKIKTSLFRDYHKNSIEYLQRNNVKFLSKMPKNCVILLLCNKMSYYCSFLYA